eukprot:PhF_6_TR40805/c1_g1_i5/m.61670/K07359/CAMKK2; calcium/calmodulin-dependent protein kinase kinase 2
MGCTCSNSSTAAVAPPSSEGGTKDSSPSSPTTVLSHSSKQQHHCGLSSSCISKNSTDDNMIAVATIPVVTSPPTVPPPVMPPLFQLEQQQQQWSPHYPGEDFTSSEVLDQHLITSQYIHNEDDASGHDPVHENGDEFTIMVGDNLVIETPTTTARVGDHTGSNVTIQVVHSPRNHIIHHSNQQPPPHSEFTHSDTKSIQSDHSSHMKFFTIGLKRTATLVSDLVSNSSFDVQQVLSTHELVRGCDAEGNKLLNEYAVLGMLGQGAFGKVKLAIDTTTDKPVAIKILNKLMLERESRRPTILNHPVETSGDVEATDSSPRTSASPTRDLDFKTPLQLLHQEIEIMKTRKHPNLVKLINVINDPDQDKLYMVMEYMNGGAIGKTPHLSNVPAWPTMVNIPKIRRQLINVVHGLYFLHRHRVIHMDIKPENILVDEEGCCKLADFGVCTVLGENFEINSSKDVIRTKQGTPVYFAPEMLADRSFHGMATDVWALGVTMYVMVYGRLPFGGTTLMEYQENVRTSEPEFPSLDGAVPTSLIDILRRMLEKAPTLRVTVRQLVGHPFLVEEREHVPLGWWVRMWKEHRIATCKDDKERTRLVLSIHNNLDEHQVCEAAVVISSPLFCQIKDHF